MSRPSSGRPAKKGKTWWRYARNRNRVWLGLFVALVGVAVAGFVWIAAQGGGGEPAVGEQVEAFELPEVVSGETFSLSDYLGKKDIVVVSYMGFF